MGFGDGSVNEVVRGYRLSCAPMAPRCFVCVCVGMLPVSHVYSARPVRVCNSFQRCHSADRHRHAEHTCNYPAVLLRQHAVEDEAAMHAIDLQAMFSTKPTHRRPCHQRMYTCSAAATQRTYPRKLSARAWRRCCCPRSMAPSRSSQQHAS